MAHRLSKSRFQTGLQCPKALWLKCHRPELADEVGEQQQHVLDTGTAVGELARTAFPGGVLVDADHTRSAEALSMTAELLEDPPPALFEAAFDHSGVFVRPDVLARAPDGSWDLYEVKSSTRLKPEHITDVAIQVWVLEGAGLSIRRAYLMHLDSAYVYDGEHYDVRALFASEDVTDPAREFMTEVPRLVAEQLAMLDGPEPDVRIGKRCDNPYTCAFKGYCHAFLPERPITALPRLSDELLGSLLAAGHLSVEDVPDGFPGLSAAQRALCELVRSGEARIGPGAAATLRALEHPLHFLDFETIMSALPLYAGTRPWQQVPFQWSDHVMHSDGALEHHDFLHESGSDPREPFLVSLLDTLGDEGSIVVYSAFESTRLKELAEAMPLYAGRIERVQSRLFDLLRVVRAHVRHPDCLGSASIKAVLPALAPDLSYAGLEIADGGTASLRYLKTVTGASDTEEAAQTFAALRTYCALDTLAMVRIYKVLLGDP